MKDCPASAGSCWCSRVACCCSRSPQIQSWVLGNSIENLPDMELWPPSLSPLIVPGCIRGFTHRLDVKNREAIPGSWWHSDLWNWTLCDSQIWLNIIFMNCYSLIFCLCLQYSQNILSSRCYHMKGALFCIWRTNKHVRGTVTSNKSISSISSADSRAGVL